MQGAPTSWPFLTSAPYKSVPLNHNTPASSCSHLNTCSPFYFGHAIPDTCMCCSLRYKTDATNFTGCRVRNTSSRLTSVHYKARWRQSCSLVTPQFSHPCYNVHSGHAGISSTSGPVQKAIYIVQWPQILMAWVEDHLCTASFPKNMLGRKRTAFFTFHSMWPKNRLLTVWPKIIE